MDFSGETEQHRVIHYSLEDLHTMIKEAQTDLSKFDVEKMKMQMIALKEPLVRLDLCITVIIQSDDLALFSTHIWMKRSNTFQRTK